MSQAISVVVRIVKLLRSSGRGVAGLSKTVVGVLVILLGAFGLDWAASIVQGQETGLTEALQKIVEGVGVLLTVWGAIAKQAALEKARNETQ